MGGIIISDDLVVINNMNDVRENLEQLTNEITKEIQYRPDISLIFSSIKSKV